jgi:putative peptidoglycan lipid II flippase
MGAAAAVVSASVLASRLLGLLRDTLLAALLGVTTTGDVYRNAFVLPDLINYLLAGGFLSITFIPILSRRIERGEIEEGWRDFTAVFRVVGLAIAGLTVGGMLAAGPVVRAVFVALSASDQETIARLTRVVLPAQVFFVLGALFMAVQYTRRRFLVPALAPVIYNLGIIGGGLLGGSTPDGFVWGAVVGSGVGNFGLQWWGARRAGLRWRPGGGREATMEYLTLALPLMVGQSIAVLDEQIPRVFGQLAGAGGTAALSFARSLNMLPVGLIAQAAGVASYPFLARLAARESWQEMADTTLKALRTTLTFSLFASAAVYAVAQPAVRVVFQWGRFGTSDTARVAALLVILGLSIPAWGLHQVIARSFYASRRMWTPVAIGTSATVVAIPLTLLLHRGLGLTGIALASTVVMWGYALAMTGVWAGGSGWRHLLAAGSALFRLLPVALAAAVAGRLVSDALAGDAFAPALLATLVGTMVCGAIYLAFSRLLGVRLRGAS